MSDLDEFEREIKDRAEEKIAEAAEESEDLSREEAEEFVVDADKREWLGKWCPAVTFQGDRKSLCDALEEIGELMEDTDKTLDEILGEEEEPSTDAEETEAEQERLTAQ